MARKHQRFVLKHRMFANYSMLVVIICIFVSGGCELSRNVVFPRDTIPQDRWRAPPADAEVLWIESDQGPVEAWILPGAGVSGMSPGPAVMVAHGNAELIDDYPSRLSPYRSAGITVMLCEYRGYGRSAGSPSEKRVVDDFKKFREALAERDEVDETRIFYHGRSLGGGVVCALMKDHSPAALILESTFTSLKELTRDHNLPAWLLADEFDSRTALKEHFRGPLLVLHGRHDRVVPLHHGAGLAMVVKNSRVTLFDVDHNEPMPQEAYWRAIFSFLREERIIDE